MGEPNQRDDWAAILHVCGRVRCLALPLEPGFLAATVSQVPHRVRKLVPDISDRGLASFPDLFLQFGRDQIQSLGNGLKVEALQVVREPVPEPLLASFTRSGTYAREQAIRLYATSTFAEMT